MTKRKPCSSTTSKLVGYDREAMLALLLQHNGVASHAAQSIGASDASMRRRLKALEITREEVQALLLERDAVKPGEVRESDNGDGTKTITAGYKTLDEAIEGHGIDLDAWQIVGDPQPNSFTGPIGDGVICHHHQWKFRIRERAANDPKVVEKRFEERLAKLAAGRPLVKCRHKKVRPGKGLVLEVTCPDFHFGMQAHREETGNEWNLDIAERVWLGMLREVLAEIELYGDRIAYVVFRFGDDFYHVDNWLNTTTNGTRQNVDGSVHRILSRGEDLIVHTTEKIKERARLLFLPIPGNHGFQNELRTATVVKHHFHRDEAVTVAYADQMENPFKFYRHGCCTVMSAHGKTKGRTLSSAVLAGNLMQKAIAHGYSFGPSDWWREVRTAHVHHKKGEELNGVRVTTLPSLTAVDEWHEHSLYSGNIRAGEIYLLHPDTGEHTRRTITIKAIEAGLPCAA